MQVSSRCRLNSVPSLSTTLQKPQAVKIPDELHCSIFLS